jgi:predicted aspartyl protease
MPLVPLKVNSFTTAFNGIANVIFSEIQIAPAFDPLKTTEFPQHKPYKAIWDTGATNTVITPKVVQECGLQPISRIKVHSASGEYEASVYLINVVLRNNVGFAKLRVTEGNFIGADVLIGMDLISKGDLALTNYNGKTTFSFRSPSIETIDFVKQTPNKGAASMPISPQKITQPISKVGRNKPCPCGSGKKYKKCCGK